MNTVVTEVIGHRHASASDDDDDEGDLVMEIGANCVLNFYPAKSSMSSHSGNAAPATALVNKAWPSESTRLEVTSKRTRTSRSWTTTAKMKKVKKIVRHRGKEMRRIIRYNTRAAAAGEALAKEAAAAAAEASAKMAAAAAESLAKKAASIEYSVPGTETGKVDQDHGELEIEDFTFLDDMECPEAVEEILDPDIFECVDLVDAEEELRLW